MVVLSSLLLSHVLRISKKSELVLLGQELSVTELAPYIIDQLIEATTPHYYLVSEHIVKISRGHQETAAQESHN